MADLRVGSSSEHTPEELLQQHCGQNTHPGPQEVVLYPPSYFKNTSTGAQEAATHAQAELDEYEGAIVGSRSAAAASPANTYVVSRESSMKPQLTQGEVAALRLQNEALRAQLQALQHSATTTAPFHPHCTPGILSSNLLQVECGLQSQLLARSEAESRRLSKQLVTVERLLADERASHIRDRETLVSEHRAAIECVMGEKREAEERWGREGEEWRERVEMLEERETEKEGELITVQEQLTHETQEKAGLVCELDKETTAHREEVASLNMQLNNAHDQTRSLQSELQTVRGRVAQLESYLGGELPVEGSGVTWREERATLLERIIASVEDHGTMESESQLMAVRLAAISEILTLQEKALTQEKDEALVSVMQNEDTEGGGKGSKEEKREGEGDGGREGEGEGLKRVLSLWREKVFALLVQARVREIEHSTELQETHFRISCLGSQVNEVTRERDLLSHTLTDRTAQLQLQIKQTELLKREVKEAEQAREASESAMTSLSSQLQLAMSGVREVGEKCARFKSCVDGCLSRLASYEQRVGVANRRVAALRAMLSNLLALREVGSQDHHPHSNGSSSERNGVTIQTELAEQSQELSKLSQCVLVEEVVSLMRERESLTDQLSHSTTSLQLLRQTALEKQQALEERCSSLQAETSSLTGQLEEMRAELVGLREREAQIHSTQASLQARIDSAVMEERRKGCQELSEVQSLLEVARREQAKTALDLQRTERKLQSECANAVEAVELSKRGVEGELVRCRERLRAVQVERNLLLTTLRQEGIKIPPKRPLPVQSPPSTGASQTLSTTQPPTIIEQTQPLTHHDASRRYPLCNSAKSQLDTCVVPHSRTPSPSPPLSRSPSHSPPCESSDANATGDYVVEAATGVGRGDCVSEETHHKDMQQHKTGETIRTKMSPQALLIPVPTCIGPIAAEEDIHSVLKELQLLSTSLLDMKAGT